MTHKQKYEEYLADHNKLRNNCSVDDVIAFLQKHKELYFKDPMSYEAWTVHNPIEVTTIETSRYNELLEIERRSKESMLELIKNAIKKHNATKVYLTKQDYQTFASQYGFDTRVQDVVFMEVCVHQIARGREISHYFSPLNFKSYDIRTNQPI
jgi:aspartyl-tRNA synthetase